MFYIGIDDAGRGPVIGPMVLAGILVDEKQEAKLRLIKVKDSKLLSPQRREFLAREIKKIATAHCILKISAKEIDKLIAQKINLNKIEAIKAAEIINILTKNIIKAEVIIDCPSTNTQAWKNYLLSHIKDKEKIVLKCEHKADVHYPVVSAASILAKVTRDSEMDKIKKQYDIECGSGYPSDPLCTKFLKTPKAKELAKLGLIRKSWQTWGREIKKDGQKKLGEF
ncbi:MAG: ribonuclease HII [Candidatus Pacearchaeota archaeon]|nr:ribonuclease HII [Candidatus Pacearchaeota archaeon]